MNIPVIATPKFKTKLPSNNQEVIFRPFLVKEQKNLLIAAQGKDSREIAINVINIVKQCVDQNLNIDTLPFFDVQWLFLQLRAKSVGEIININLKHKDDNPCTYIHKDVINIEHLQFSHDPKHSNRIMLTDKVGVVMKYPSLSNIESQEQENQIQQIVDLIAKNIQCVFDQDNVYDSFTLEEANTFIDSLTTQQVEKIGEFFNTMPKLVHIIDWKCPKCNTEEHIEIEGLQNFF